MCETRGHIVAVGFFDGVHRGHQAILAGASAALTFREHPLSVVAPERVPPLVMTLAERLEAIRESGVREVTALPFTADLAALSPEAFSHQYFDGVSAVRCGENWRFGSGGRGDAELLRRLGYAVEVVPSVLWAGMPVSSTRLRAALAAGKLDEAAALLGRHYSLSGEVVKGKGVGRQLGFPTVNVRLDRATTLLPLGAYIVAAKGARAVANFGLAPTLGSAAWSQPMIELHFLDLLPDCPLGTTLKVEWLAFLRPERCFVSKAELSRQIHNDCQAARIWTVGI